jgi:3-oxoacyl-[acyl-carrier protein] reductase
MKETKKVALITGGSKGIGLGVAEALISSGYAVVITSRTESELHRSTQYLNARVANSASGVVADVRSMEEMEQTIAHCIATFGRLDILIANAGVGHFAAIKDLTAQQWSETMDINLTGVFNSVKASLDQLIANQGYVITIASLAGTNFFAKGTAYNASKFGLVGFSQALMMDLRDHGVKVTTIMPGSVATYFNNHTPTDADSWKIQPEDIGQMVVDLLKMNPRTLPSKIEVRPSKTK